MSIRICAQQTNYVFQNLTSKDGLTSEFVQCIFQDSKGFYWLGGDDGISKFDGKNFYKVISNTLDETRSSLSWPKINITQDKQKNIWIYMQGAIYVFQPEGKIDTIKIKDDSAYKSQSNIFNFCINNEDNVWIYTSLNFYKYDRKLKKCIHWMPLPALSYWVTNTIYDSIKKGVWIGINDDIHFINIKGKTISRPFSHNRRNASDISPGTYIQPIWMDREQNLWFGCSNGLLYKYNTITCKKNVYNLPYDKNKSSTINSFATCYVEDNQKRIWIGCYNAGFHYYDERADTIYSIRINGIASYSLRFDNKIFDLYIDKEENIWTGTDKGVSVFNPAFQQFTTVDENNLGNIFPKVAVSKIFQTNKGSILVGTWGRGWFIYDQYFNLKKHLYNVDTKNFILSFTEDNKGKIWISYLRGLIGIYDPEKDKIEYKNIPELNDTQIETMKSDKEGNIWFGSTTGVLSKLDINYHKIIVYDKALAFLNHTGGIKDIVVVKKDEIWIATAYDGFYRFNPVKEKVTEHYSDNVNSSLDNYVTDLSEINDSIIGVSTFSKGFMLFHKTHKTFAYFNKQNGLPNNNIFGLATDKQNNIWIATGNGLLRMNARNNKLVSFNEEDGLLNKQFLHEITYLNGGRASIATTTGFVYFSLNTTVAFKSPPDVQITSFKVLDKPLSVDSMLSGNKKIELNHSQNFITIGFSSISFLGRNTIQYFYQLQGVDKNWRTAGKQRFATYSDLNPGHYIFRVKCKNRDDISSKKITELSIYISPPWWSAWWAYLLYILLGGIVVYTAYRDRIKQLKSKQSDQIKAMVITQEEERKRISRDLHDDIGTKLSALKLFISSLQNKATLISNEEIRSLAESSEKFIKEAMQDVRELLLNLSPTVLEEFGYTTAVEGIINKINETKQIHFSLVMFGMAHRLKKDYELALYRITQELINNVLKHAEAKNVSLQIGQRDEKIILMIEDDGKGFDINAHKDGYGLHNLNARTKLMHGIMTIDSQPGKGTSVLIEIPYNFNGT